MTEHEMEYRQMPLEQKDFVICLREAMDSFARMSMFHDEMRIKTHLLGMHGQKVYNRYHEKETLKMIYCIQHYLIDHIDDIDYNEIQPCYECIAYEDHYDIRNVKDYLDFYLDMLEDEKECLNIIASDLSKINGIVESELIKQYLPCISDQIKNVLRWRKDYENSGWDWSYIRHVDEKLHKKYKEKEKSEYHRESHDDRR